MAEITRHADSGLTVPVEMPRRGLRAEVRIGLTDDGRVLVRAVTVMPASWASVDDTAPTDANVASAYLREVPLSEALAAAFNDPDFRHEAQARAAQARDGEHESTSTDRGATFKHEELQIIARHYLRALQTKPRSAVKETQRTLAADYKDMSLPRIRDRLRVCYERAYLLKTDTPGKAGAVAGPELGTWTPAGSTEKTGRPGTVEEVEDFANRTTFRELAAGDERKPAEDQVLEVTFDEETGRAVDVRPAQEERHDA